MSPNACLPAPAPHYRGPWACTHRGDLSRQWCVRYKLLMPSDEQGEDGPPRWRTLRISHGINRHADIERREAALRYVLAVVRAQLALGQINATTPLPELVPRRAPTPALPSPGSERPLIESLELLLPILRPQRSPKTYLQLRYATQLLGEYLSQVGLLGASAGQMTAERLQDFSDYLLARRCPPQGRALSARTHRNAIKTLITLSRALERRSAQLSQPRAARLTQSLQALPLLTPAAGRNLAFPPELRDRLLLHLAQHDAGLYRLVLLLYGCFIRPRIEARAIRLGDLDLKRQRLLISAAASKNRQQQAVAIPRHVLRALAGLDPALPSSYYLFGRDLLPGPEPMAVNTAYARHRVVLQQLGITGPYALYSWKDTGNRDAANAGVPLHELMLQNRHTDLSVTTKYFKRLGLQTSSAMAELDLNLGPGAARQMSL